MHWVEWIGKSGLDRGFRHELRNTLCAFFADVIDAQPALLPKQIGEERYRQVVVLGRGEQGVAQIVERRWLRQSGLRIALRVCAVEVDIGIKRRKAQRRVASFRPENFDPQDTWS